MRDDRTPSGRRGTAWAAAALALLLAGAAHAEGLRGFAQLQYQRSEQTLLALGPDGALHELRSVREFWTQTYEVTHAARFRSGLSVFSQFRLNDVSYVNSAEGARTPYGTLRLAHPWFGLAGSYEPVTVTTALRSASLFPTADTTGQAVATFRTEQSQLSGYLNAPRLPRVDVSWIRRHRGADLQGAAQSGLARNAIASWGVGPLLLRGGYSDQGSGGNGFSPENLVQRSANGGAGLQLHPTPKMSFGVDYDFAQTRHGITGPGRRDLSRSNTASVNGLYSPSRMATVSLNYGYRRDLLESGLRSVVTNHEGALLLTLQGRNGTRLVSGGGVRTSHLGLESEVLRYATAVLSWEGRVRSGWLGGASASHVTNWNPGDGTFSVDAWHANTRMTLRRGLDFLVDWLVTDTGDSTARNLRWTTQSSIGVQATPLRSFSANVNVRQYRAGPGLFRSEAIARGAMLDVRWRPWASFETDASFGHAGVLPNDRPRLATTAVNARWSPWASLQFTGTYTRSTQSRLATQQLIGREVYGGRVLAALGRSWNVNAGLYAADPGSSHGTRQVDASFTRSFGR